MRTLRYANAVLGRLNLRDLARPHLEELVHEVGETATLSIPGEADAITVDFVPTDRYLQGVTRLGRPSVGHASSAGKVMLAFGDVPLPRGKLAAFTPQTITDPARWRARSSRCAARAGPRRSRSARSGSARSPPRCGARAASSRRSWRCRARRAGSTAAAIAAAVPLLVTCAQRISVAARLARVIPSGGNCIPPWTIPA